MFCLSMLLFGHIGITLGVFIVLGILHPQINSIIDKKFLIIGALLPDLIDKPLRMVIFSSCLANGRIIGHTLLFSVIILLIGLFLYDKKMDIRILSCHWLFFPSNGRQDLGRPCNFILASIRMGISQRFCRPYRIRIFISPD